MNEQEYLRKEFSGKINNEINQDVNQYLATSDEIKFMYYFLDMIIALCATILLTFFILLFQII